LFLRIKFRGRKGTKILQKNRRFYRAKRKEGRGLTKRIMLNFAVNKQILIKVNLQILLNLIKTLDVNQIFSPR